MGMYREGTGERGVPGSAGKYWGGCQSRCQGVQGGTGAGTKDQEKVLEQVPGKVPEVQVEVPEQVLTGSGGDAGGP